MSRSSRCAPRSRRWTTSPSTPSTPTCALHLLSHRLIKPHEANLDGIFGLLANVVWTNFGPAAVEGFELVRAKLRRRGAVTVYGIDKFPGWSTT